MVTRTTKTTRNSAPKFVAKPTVVETAEIKDEVHGAEPKEFSASDYVKNLFSQLGLEAPTWKRQLLAWLASLGACAGVGYLMGQIIGYAMVGAILLTGSAFIPLVIYAIGVVIAIYASYRVGPIVYMAVIDKTVDRMASSAWNKATGLFRSSGHVQGVPA